MRHAATVGDHLARRDTYIVAIIILCNLTRLRRNTK